MRRVTACLVSVVMGQRASAKSTMHGWWHTRAAQNSGRAKMQMPDECRKELEEPKAADVVAGWQCDGGEASARKLGTANEHGSQLASTFLSGERASCHLFSTTTNCSKGRLLIMILSYKSLCLLEQSPRQKVRIFSGVFRHTRGTYSTSLFHIDSLCCSRSARYR
jgi:hypothetical protein